ncbi:hypothetical protein [Actinomadura flavalba]|uniref:hypothetical protein n=1 Tax=Actinomadura flavalba TaxID=1120938 RepID=UPI000369C666|nr:hypothetical protein [Actinomadura flavalba]
MNDATQLDLSRLSPAQRKGAACVICRVAYGKFEIRSVPVAVVDGGQVFACVVCADAGAIVAEQTKRIKALTDGDSEGAEIIGSLLPVLNRIAVVLLGNRAAAGHALLLRMAFHRLDGNMDEQAYDKLMDTLRSGSLDLVHERLARVDATADAAKRAGLSRAVMAEVRDRFEHVVRKHGQDAGEVFLRVIRARVAGQLDDAETRAIVRPVVHDGDNSAALARLAQVQQ